MRPREPFTLYSRKNKKGENVWYYRITDDTGRSTGRSTFQTSKTAARTYVVNLIKDGKLPQKDPRFSDFARDWWIWDKCKYVRGKLARGVRISQSYVDIRRGYLETHILPYFKNKRISSIKPHHIEEWLMSLREKTGRYGKTLSATSVNQILSTLRIMFNEGQRKGLFDFNPITPIDPLKENRREKSYLEPEEIKNLFDPDKLAETWAGDLKHYTLNILAASTGMRLGECQALQNQYVNEGYIDVRFSWARKYGFKEPKLGSVRKIPLPSRTYFCLRELQLPSPFQEPDDLVFWGPSRKIPVDHKTIAEVLYSAFEKIGISNELRKERNLSFHSWRHFFNSYFRTRIPDIKLQRLTGHKSIQMVDHYTHFKIEDFRDVVKIQEDFFTNG